MLIDPCLDLDGLISAIYGDLMSRIGDPYYLKCRAILSCKNEEVDFVNEILIGKQIGNARTYLSVDQKVNTTDDNTQDDITEFFNSLTCLGTSNHCLILKIGTPVILLRNINQSIGLCNGTRLTITKLGDRLIEGRIITGSHAGTIVIIPRIIMTTEKGDFPFVLRRKQFPIKVAYAMTINKSQGHTLAKIGLYLPSPLFCHGQLYVAISRATSSSSIKILRREQSDILPNYTLNILYRRYYKTY